ncbi:Tip elongation aberrant protein Tea4 [Ilyonectria robusta]
MTRPTIIRADTIDLQDHHSPSAQDHSRSPHIKANADSNSLAPHQAETIREVSSDAADEQSRSPRISWDHGDTGDIHQFAEDLVGGPNHSKHRDDDEDRRMTQEDALAIAQNGGISSSDEGDLDGDADDLDDDMMDKISSSPSIEDEDIDFEFVYALHTFVATVEGQANATKGDTMVLLDDSNSYWWLVRVVKDSSIGYLPAEHIETPTERLARLNKHRNVDLSATMLGDQQDKKPQTFKTAIRLKRKTVAFAPPTYVDYSDFDDYSTDEEDLDELFAGHTSTTQQQQEQKESQQQTVQASVEDDNAPVESAKVEPLKPRVNRDVKLVMESTKVETVMEEDETRNSEEILLDTKPEGPSRSRNGTVRNTDSFFKDDTVETKKITLTPNLLRDDNQPRPSTDSVTKDVKSRGSMDKLDKELMSDKEKKKIKERERKEKEKKPSAIRSFFSRKEKKKSVDEDDESFGKRSMDTQSESVGRSSESPSLEEPVSADKIQRSPSKLQKQLPRTEPSPTRKGPGSITQPSSTMELAAYLNETRTNDVSNVPPATMRIVDSETNETQEVPSHHANASQQRSASAAAQRDEKSAASKGLHRSASTGADTRAQKMNRSRPRTDLDDISSDEDLESETPDASEEEKSKEQVKPKRAPGAFPDTADSAANTSDATATDNKGQQQNRLSESPVQVSPVNATRPPALEIDTSSQEGRSSEEVPSPELLHGDEVSKSSGSTRSGKESSWDDEKLRTFFDESEHVRDLLAVVYDKTNVEPASKDHPVVSGLFREQNAKLAEITTQLDNMLGDWLARKQRLRGSV